jgi:hypothetical protein
MICFLDIDGVVGNFAEYCKEFFGVEIEARKLMSPNSHVIQTLKTNSAICRKFILGIKPYWYVPELLQVLNKNFEKIMICSKPLTLTYEEARFEWVKNYLGEKYSRNFIFNVERKELFAGSSCFLIDDIKSNCQKFIHGGGYALHWHEEDFEAMVAEILKIRNKMSMDFMKNEIVRLENIK